MRLVGHSHDAGALLHAGATGCFALGTVMNAACHSPGGADDRHPERRDDSGPAATGNRVSALTGLPAPMPECAPREHR